jgi:hypothetical protein
MQYKHLIQSPRTKTCWTHSFANELGQLTQGVGTHLKGTDTCFFIDHSTVPKDHTITYGRIVLMLHPQKTKVECTRLTVRGNLIDYPSNISTKMVDLTTAKIIFNSVLSMPGAKFMGINLKHFYLNTPLNCYKYMCLPIAIIPDEIIQQYTLLPLVHQGYIYMEIWKGMYGLPKADLGPNPTRPVPHLLGTWQQQSCILLHQASFAHSSLPHASHLTS